MQPRLLTSVNTTKLVLPQATPTEGWQSKAQKRHTQENFRNDETMTGRFRWRPSEHPNPFPATQSRMRGPRSLDRANFPVN